MRGLLILLLVGCVDVARRADAAAIMFALFPSLRLVASEHLWIGDSDV